MSDNSPEKREENAGKVNSEPAESLKPNKSTLHAIVKTVKTIQNVTEDVKKEEKSVQETDNKLEKNVSTLYRLISNQNVILKPLKGTALEDDDDGIEYENIMENSSPDNVAGRDTVDNALYYGDQPRPDGKSLSKTTGKSSELKKSSLEIRISPPILPGPNLKRCHSAVETVAASVTAHKTDSADLSAIRFSFLDGKEEDKRESVYDTIDESNNSVQDGAASSVGENFYSSPRTSLTSQTFPRDGRSQGGEYVMSDQEGSGSADGDSELFYAASEVLNVKPSPSSSSASSSSPPPPPPPSSSSPNHAKESMDYEDVELENEKLPDLPTQEEKTDPEEYADVDVNDYCRHRAENPRKLDLNPKEKKAIVKVRSKINKAWKSMKNWINEERNEGTRETGRRLPRATTIDMIKVLREEKDVVEVETTDRSESPTLCALTDNVHFLENERWENSDCGTYVDMSRSQVSDTSGELFPGFTLLRKRRETSSASPSLRKSRFYPEGQNGFEELRRYIKQGGDFCKELSVILQERSEAENQYAKSLTKLSHKLLKTSKDAVGSVAEAWQRIGAEMEAQSEVHRNFAAALSEEVVKPLKQLMESQHRIRKNVEGIVDKTGKTLTEWRQAECKSKKQSFLCARENEKLQDTMLDLRNLRNASTLHLHHHNHKNVSDKETAKMDLKRKKAEESVKKADIEYYSFCVRAERCRLDWETAVTRGSHCFQGLEEERLSCLKSLAFCYLKQFKEIGPRLVQSSERLADPIETCDVTRDIQTVAAMKGSSQPMQEQLLPDFYAEHVTLAMNRDRRRQALVKLLQLIVQDLERERRGKEGVENLQRALQQTPNFGAEESQQNVDDKLHHMKSMLIYLEAARYKVQSALAELDGKPKQSHPLATHIHMTRDRQGLQQSVLRVPCWAKNESMADRTGQESPDWAGRESGDGTSVQPDSDFDEFSSVGSDKDYQCSVYNDAIISDCNGEGEKGELGQCRALYEYTAKVYDELNLRIGDIIKIHDKHPDGWWLGELDGVVGIFPATYVEEIH